MHVTGGIVAVILAVPALAGPTSAQSALPAPAQARAISAAYAARVSELGDSAIVEGCALTRLLGDPAAYRAYLSPLVRDRLGPGDRTSCAAEARGTHRQGLWWYVDGVVQKAGGEVEVRTRLLVPHTTEREETYLLRPGADGAFHVGEIRIRPGVEKLTQPLVPPRRPPVTQPAPGAPPGPCGAARGVH